jgi:hypothetical protein
MKMFPLAAAVAAAVLTVATAAEAKIYKAVANETGAFITDTETYHPITSVDATATSFRLASKRRVAITFSAKCQSPLDIGIRIWVGIEIDGTIVKPTADRDDAFCSGGDNRTGSYSLTVSRALGAGKHTVRVKAGTNALDPFARLHDSTLVIFD